MTGDSEREEDIDGRMLIMFAQLALFPIEAVMEYQKALQNIRSDDPITMKFGHLKEYRRIATCYDKTARYYLAMVKPGCIRLFYKRLCN